MSADDEGSGAEPQPETMSDRIRRSRDERREAAHRRVFGPPPDDTDTDEHGDGVEHEDVERR